MLNPEARRTRTRLAAMARWCRKRARFFLAFLVLASLTCVDENAPDWLLKAAQEADAMVRKVMPLLRAAQQHVEEAYAAQPAAGLSLLSGPELVLAMDAGMRELLAAVRQRNVIAHAQVATASASALPGSVIVKQDADVARADDREAPPASVSSPTDLGVPLDAKTVFLALLWVFTILLPLKIGQVPPEVQTIIRDFLATVNFALMIHWRVSDSRKR